MNTDYKLTKYLVNSRNQEFDLSSMLKYEIETFTTNYKQKMNDIHDISTRCQNKTYIIIKNTEQSKYFGQVGFGHWFDNKTGNIEYVGCWRHGVGFQEVDPYTGVNKIVKYFMEEEDLRKLSFDDIKKIKKYLDIRDEYYYLKKDYSRIHGDITKFENYKKELEENSEIDMNFMENIFSESMKLIYEQSDKPITNYQQEMERLYDVKFEFLDYNIAKDIYNMTVLHDDNTFKKYNLSPYYAKRIWDHSITNLIKKLVEQSYVYHQMYRRLSDPILRVAIMLIELEIPVQESDNIELNNKITNAINYITSQ